MEPEKRYTAQQALNHPWISGNAAQTTVMPGVIEKMQEFNAHRRLKAHLLLTLAAKKWAKLSNESNK